MDTLKRMASSFVQPLAKAKDIEAEECDFEC